MTNTKGKILNFDHARTKEQRELMAKIIEDGVCPFCWENFEKYHPKPIIAKNNSWLMTENMSPYEGSRVHYLFVYKNHTNKTTEVTKEGFAGLLELINKAITTEDILGGTLLMRFGDTDYTGGSVEHLHAQLVVGGPKTKDGEKIKQKIGYKI